MSPFTSHHLTGTVCVLLASLLWGTTGTAATFAPEVGPLAIGAVAMGAGGLLQAVAAAPSIRRESENLRAQTGIVLLGALAVAAYPLAFYSSMHLAGVATGTVVSIGSAPLASALIERTADGHRLTPRWMAGAALGLTGTALLCAAKATDASKGTESATGTVLGVCLGLIAGGTYALYSWTAHRLINKGIASPAAMGTIFGTGGVLLLPILLTTGAPLLTSWPNAAVGAYMALIPMFLGYVLFGHGLTHIPASTATTLSLLEPAVAALLAVLLLNEHLPTLAWTGIALVVACLATLTTTNPAPQQTPTPTPTPTLDTL